jgi:hypothetical protein
MILFITPMSTRWKKQLNLTVFGIGQLSHEAVGLQISDYLSIQKLYILQHSCSMLLLYRQLHDQHIPE